MIVKLDDLRANDRLLPSSSNSLTSKVIAVSNTTSSKASAVMNFAFASVSNCSWVIPFMAIEPCTVSINSSDVPSGQ
jgi:hypothetical protein